MTSGNDWQWSLGSLAGPVLLTLIMLAALSDRWRRRRQAAGVADGPEDEPYRIYTSAFDLEIDAADVTNRIADASPDFYRGWTDRNGEAWQRNRELTRDFAARQPSVEAIAEIIRPALDQAGGVARDTAVTLLVDQSGSMRGPPIAATAAAAEVVSQALSRLDIRHEILGFSTAGWHGGRARDAWLRAGRPKRPGRLCVLLHVVYKRFDESSWNERSRDAFVHPDILRENVDGEAIDWAAARLERIEASHRVLLVVTDGAPVDDATLISNGPSYLIRAARRSIARVEAEGKVVLGAVGVGDEQWVADLYPRKRNAALEGIAPMAAEMLGELIASSVSP